MTWGEWGCWRLGLRAASCMRFLMLHVLVQLMCGLVVCSVLVCAEPLQAVWCLLYDLRLLHMLHGMLRT